MWISSYRQFYVNGCLDYTFLAKLRHKLSEMLKNNVEILAFYESHVTIALDDGQVRDISIYSLVDKEKG